MSLSKQLSCKLKPVHANNIYPYRCLFGPVDKNKIDEMLDQNLAQLQADKKAEIKAKFNFDVDEEQPIETR